ncbi:MAG TPA: nucleotidyltransferase domain-containing protein [Gammaproteobacteria bacterium]|nr:nucleotidyltransferase domain-containing protein [Gammaproteobacteria bacterium]
MSCIKNDSRFSKLIPYVQNKYNCHTIILYGSRARGDHTEKSDYDLMAIREKGKRESHSEIFQGFDIEIALYSEEQDLFQDNNENYVRIREGIVLCQKDNLADRLIERGRENFKNGPAKFLEHDKQFCINFANKMLKRIRKDDVEARYRHCWLIFALLQIYFELRDKWYLGPKEALKWLEKNDSATYSAFDLALRSGADISSLEKLVNYVIGTLVCSQIKPYE